MRMACQRFEESMRRKTISFQIDNTTAVPYLMNMVGNHCKTLNCLTRKILLKFHENGVTVCPEYLKGVSNLWADALSREKKAHDWSLGNPACHRLFKHWGAPIVDLFVSSQAHKVPQIL